MKTIRKLLKYLVIYSAYSSSVFAINHWSASIDQVKNVNCHRGIPAVEDMYSFIKSKSVGIKSHIKINDFKHAGLDQNEVDLLTKLIHVNVKDGRAVNVNLPDTSMCEDLRCILNNLFDDESNQGIGIMYAYVLSKYGLNPSHYVNHLSKTYTLEEFNSVLFGLEAIPTSLLPIFNNKRLARYYDPNEIPGETRNLANSSLEFFDYWSTFDFYERAFAVYHEVAHNLGDPLKIMYSSNWYDVAGWGNDNGRYYIVNDTQTSLYAKEFPNEDFAESVSAYRFNPELLYSKSPEKYDFLKWSVYKGIDFRNDLNCEKNLVNTRIKQIADQAIFTLTDLSKTELLRSCDATIIKSYIDMKSNEEARGCINKALIKKSIEENDVLEDGLKFLVSRDEMILKGLDIEDSTYKQYLKEIYSDIRKELEATRNDVLKYAFLPDLKRKGKAACFSNFNFAHFAFSPISIKYNYLNFTDLMSQKIIKHCEDNLSVLLKSKDKFFDSFINSLHVNLN